MAKKKKEKKKTAKAAARRGKRALKKSKKTGGQKTPRAKGRKPRLSKTSRSAKGKRLSARRATKRIAGSVPAAAGGSERETLVVTPAGTPPKDADEFATGSQGLAVAHEDESLEIIEAPGIEDEEEAEW